MVLKTTLQKKVLNNYFLESFQKQPYVDLLQNRCSQKFSNIHRKTSVLESFLVKWQALWPATLFKRDFNPGIFLRILRNFYEQLFLQNTSGDICQSSLLNQKQYEKVSTKQVCRSVQSTLFTNYQQKPLKHAFIDWPTENKNLFKVKHCSKGYLF